MGKRKYMDRDAGYKAYVEGGGSLGYQDWTARNRSRQLESQANTVLNTGKVSGGILSGTEKEKRGQLAGLNLGALSYGQGLAETGRGVQDIIKLLKGRVDQSGGDPATAGLMSQKANAEANARRNMMAGGARGSAIAGTMEALGRQQNQQIAQSLYGQSRQSIMDLKDVYGSIIGNTLTQMQGGKAANIDQPKMPKQEKGLLGKLGLT